MDLRALVQDRKGFLFLPLVYRLAARLEQMAWEELAEDPASAAFALRSAQRLFRLPAIVSHFRIGVEAEACGADLGRSEDGDWDRPIQLAEPSALQAKVVEQPPLAQVLEVTRRLSQELRGEAAIVGVLTGPRTLGSLLMGPPKELDQFYAVLARVYSEAGAGLLTVVEAPGAQPLPAQEEQVLKPLLNVARYFRLPAVLLDRGRARPAEGFDLTLSEACGGLLPLAALETTSDNPGAWRTEGMPLLVTEWEVPPRFPAERLVAWVEALGSPGHAGSQRHG